MNNLIFNNENESYSEIFTKCFISLENCSKNLFPNFRCTVWNQPREGIVNIRSCWQFDFYADNPFKAMGKGFLFVVHNIKNDFKLNYEECLKLRNEINGD